MPSSCCARHPRARASRGAAARLSRRTGATTASTLGRSTSARESSDGGIVFETDAAPFQPVPVRRRRARGRSLRPALPVAGGRAALAPPRDQTRAPPARSGGHVDRRRGDAASRRPLMTTYRDRYGSEYFAEREDPSREGARRQEHARLLTRTGLERRRRRRRRLRARRAARPLSRRALAQVRDRDLSARSSRSAARRESRSIFPQGEGWCDLVVLRGSLQHLDRPLETLFDAHRWLRPGRLVGRACDTECRGACVPALAGAAGARSASELRRLLATGCCGNACSTSASPRSTSRIRTSERPTHRRYATTCASPPLSRRSSAVRLLAEHDGVLCAEVRSQPFRDCSGFGPCPWLRFLAQRRHYRIVGEEELRGPAAATPSSCSARAHR